MKQLGRDYIDYWKQFDALYQRAAQTAFGGPAPLVSLKSSSIYLTESLTAAATAGYELEISPAEAVGLMVILEAYAFTAKHGSISRAFRPSLRGRAHDHDSMLNMVSPSVIYLQQQPIINTFMERVTHHLQKNRR